MTGAPAAGTPPVLVLAGIGNTHRRDDAVGVVVAEQVAGLVEGARDVGPVVDALDLLGRWDGADLAVVVDAVRSGVSPGTIRLIDLGPPEAAVAERRSRSGRNGTSTHGIGLAGTLRLARSVGTAPARVLVVGIEGEDFTMGTGLTPAVARAVPGAVRQVLRAIEEVTGCA